MKLSTALDGFEIARLADGYSQNTLDIYRWALERLIQFASDPHIESITHADLRAFMGWLRNDYIPTRPNGDTSALSGSSLENAWKAIRSFFNWAEGEFDLARPDRNLAKPKYTTPEITPFNEEELQSLLKACQYTSPASTDRRSSFSMKRPTAHRDTALILLLLDTGIRVSECARLRTHDVNLKTGEVFIAPCGSGQKTKSRNVYLGKKARSAVWRYLAERRDAEITLSPDEPLFVTKDLHPMNRNTIRHLVVNIARRAGVKSAYPHKFRHTFAIQYLRNGGDIFTLQRLLGHSSLEMVRKYLTLADTDAQNAHRRASPADRWNL